MASYGVVKVCERAGISMLSLTGNKYNPNNMGLYRDDGWQFLKIKATAV